MNINGGTFSCPAGYGYAGAFKSSGKQAAKVMVYEKGVTMKSNHNSYGNSGTPFEGATGSGIQSIELPPDSKNKNFYAAPRVEITSSGTGYGATAVALVDVDRGVITNVLVTSHGWGYEQETTTVKLQMDADATSYTYANDLFTVAPNAQPGGFTKTGAMTFSLYGTNTYAQWTRVLEGTLKVMSDAAIPSNTVLTVSNGATLDLNDVAAPTFTGLRGTGGKVTNGSVKLGETITVSAKSFVDGETCNIQGTVDLSDVAYVDLVDTELLTAEHRSRSPLTLFKATTLTLPQNGVQIRNVPAGWRASLTANGFRFGPMRGSVLVIR